VTTKPKVVKSTNKSPNIPSLLKKVATVSDSTKSLSKEIKTMSKIFAENQKVLVSMKNMIDTLSTTIEHIQKQEKKINIIEGDTERLFVGLEQVRSQSNIIPKINAQTSKLQERVEKISQIHENEPKSSELMQKISDSFDSIKNNSKMIMNIADRVENVKDDLGRVSSKGDSENVIGNLKNIKSEFLTLRDYVSENADGLEEKISGLAETLNRTNASSAEFHKKSDSIVQELQKIRNVTSKESNTTTNDVIGLLKLSEYQSNIRMQAESKYGSIKEIEKMAEQTAEIVNLFDKLTIESGKKIPLPHEVRQWAVSTILNCADRWEIKFTDMFNRLLELLGRDLLKESIRLQQVRDIFGIRAVDQIRSELGLS